jgi:multidrug resistance efflux pump
LDVASTTGEARRCESRVAAKKTKKKTRKKKPHKQQIFFANLVDHLKSAQDSPHLIAATDLKRFVMLRLLFAAVLVANARSAGLDPTAPLASDFLEGETAEEAQQFVEATIGQAKSTVDSASQDIDTATQAIADAQAQLQQATSAKEDAEGELDNVITRVGGKADVVDAGGVGDQALTADYSADLFASSDVPDWEWCVVFQRK